MKSARQRAAAKRRIKLAQRARRKLVTALRKRSAVRANTWTDAE